MFVDSFICYRNILRSNAENFSGQVVENRDTFHSSKNISYARVCVQCCFNNTIITITNSIGDVIIQDSAGVHFKNAKKSTIYAAQVSARAVARKMLSRGIKSVDIVIRGIGSTRDIVVRTICAENINILSIFLCISIPFNGCRPHAAKKGS